MKVALVYDHVNKIGGAERILMTLHELFPDAPLYTGVYNAARAPWAKDFSVVTSFLQKIPFAATHHELYPGLPFLAFEQFDFSRFDVVISITSAEAKAVITSPNTLHICYCLTPTRYLWSHYQDYFSNRLLRILSAPMVSMLRLIDTVTSQRPDRYVAISETVKRRIAKYYRQNASLIFPPVDTDRFTIKKSSTGSEQSADYFLLVSRLVKYKHIELAIEACNELKVPLKIVGIGLEEARLKQLAGKTIEFLDNLTEEELIEYYQGCRALLFMAEEDFGISMVEAMACGKPVLAYGKGGAKEIVVPGVTGELFQAQTNTEVVQVIRKFASSIYNSTSCRKRAEKFSSLVFKKQFKTLVETQWKEFSRNQN